MRPYAGVRTRGAEAAGSAADVRDPDTTATALRRAHEEFGDIDVLISGAAGNFPASALEMSPDAFRSVVDIDLLGTYHVLRAAYPLLRKPGAVVINVSAPQAFLPMALQSHVCAAKAGVDMLTRVLAMEWGPDGIRATRWFPARSRRPRNARLAPTAERFGDDPADRTSRPAGYARRSRERMPSAGLAAG